MQTHLWAPEFSRLASQLTSYGVLAIVSNCCPPLKGRFSTHYSPVRHFPLTEVSFSFDLHVWSTPPAFVLSQDQTLHCQKVIFSICCQIVLAHYFFVLIISFLELTKYFVFSAILLSKCDRICHLKDFDLIKHKLFTRGYSFNPSWSLTFRTNQVLAFIIISYKFYLSSNLIKNF